MDLKTLFVVFGTVFLAELGDKTQLATVLFASKPSVSLVTVFVGASLALILASLIAVAAGSVISPPAQDLSSSGSGQSCRRSRFTRLYATPRDTAHIPTGPAGKMPCR
jgi:hypothetical protein